MIKKQPIKQYWAQDKAAFEALKAERGCDGGLGPVVFFGHCTGAPHVIAYPFSVEDGYGDAYDLPVVPTNAPGYTMFVSSSGQTVILGSDDAPYVLVYPFDKVNGFGQLIPGITEFVSPSRGCAYHPERRAVLLYEQSSTPSIRAYPLTDGSAIGSKYSDPVSLPPSILGSEKLMWHPSGDAVLAINTNASPFYYAYPFSLTSGFGAKFSDPVSLPTGSLNNTTIRNSGMTVLAGTNSQSPWIFAYRFDPATGFGTKYANPATLPSTTAFYAAFSPTDGAILISRTTSPFVTSYPFDYDTGFGTIHTALSPALPGAVRGFAFHPSGEAVAIAHANSPFISVYAWSDATGFGAKYPNPGVLPAGVVEDRLITFSPDGSVLIVPHDNSPYVTTYPFDLDTGLGVAYDPPVGLPTNNIQAVSYIP